MEGDFIKKTCCEAFFGHDSTCPQRSTYDENCRLKEKQEDKNTLIVKQAIKIDKYQVKIAEALTVLSSATSKMVCIGGPLNDNRLQFNKEQLKLIWDIFHLIKEADDALKESQK